MINIRNEIRFQTTRSGGKGGQNVNKLETAVIASFAVGGSAMLTDEQKERVLQKLGNRISKEGLLQVKAQTHRTQLQNKDDAAQKLDALVQRALVFKKARIATKPSKAAAARRIEGKKQQGERKQQRRKFRGETF